MSIFSNLEKLESNNDFSKLATAKESVEDGNYEMEVRKADLRETKSGTMTILELHLYFLGGKYEGQHLEHQMWASDASQLKKILEVFALMGFEPNTWNAKYGKKISVEMPLAVKRMPGIRLKVNKSTSTQIKNGSEVTYHNVNLRSVLTGYTAKDRPEITPEPVPDDPFGTPPDGVDDEIPAGAGTGGGAGDAANDPFKLPE